MFCEPETGTTLIGGTESAICMSYAAQLEAIAQLDRAYYLNPAPTALDRAKYYARQEVLEQARQRLYAALAAVRRATAN
jgi:hypothetical protein